MLAVVTTVAGRHGHLEHQLRGLTAGSRQPDAHIVVAMGDPGIAAVVGERARVVFLDVDDGPLPLAQARNAGAAHALDVGADRLVFLDVDCIPSPDLVTAYDAAVARYPTDLLSGAVHYLPPAPPGGYDHQRLVSEARAHPDRPAAPPPGGATPVTHDLFWSLSFAVSATAWTHIGGFCERYIGYGAEDTDFAATARVRGIGHRMIGGAEAYHQWHPSPQPPLQHLHEIVANANLFHDRWQRWPMTGWLNAFEALGVARFEGSTGRWITSGTEPRNEPGSENLRATGKVGAR